jgi:ABC-type amino acid transport substrate-binding protein
MQKADMAAAAITVSEERRTAVDFTRPFMTFDSAILMKKPADGTPPIKSLEDLAAQSVVSYGVIRDGLTESYFRSVVISQMLLRRA